MKRLKENVDPKLKPEVDHVIPIFKGGQALGLDNHQAICYSCHKGKTSKDLTKEKK
jgi:5-methylcytosine-specific restriction endonuclease McrA